MRVGHTVRESAPRFPPRLATQALARDVRKRGGEIAEHVAAVTLARIIAAPVGSYFARTLDVMDATTSFAVSNCSRRFVMLWRFAIQSKSV